MVLGAEKKKFLESILETPKPLSEEKKKAVVTASKHMRIVAGAGAGKTETITRRIAYLLLVADIEPKAIVAFTFTERAAQSMKSRIYQRVKELGGDQACAKLGEMYIGTIHGYCFRLAQDHFGYGDFDAIDENQEMALLMREGWGLGLGTSGYYPDNCVEFLKSAGVVYNELIDRTKLTEKAPDFARHLKQYESILDSHKLLTFNRMVDLSVGRLEKTPSAVANCKFLIVDEYQDINRAQEKLIRLIGKNARVFIVGDPRQSIYQWRGADESCFEKFSEIFKGCEELEITENRRSTSKIIETANTFSNTLSVKYTSMKNVRPEHGEVFLVECSSPQEEAEWICNQIEQLVKEKKACHYSDISLLFRSVSTSAGPFTQELRKKNIPYFVGGRLGLFQRDEAKALGMLFSWLVDGGTWKEGKYGVEIPHKDLLKTALAHWSSATKSAKISVSEKKIKNWKKLALSGKFSSFTKAFNELLILLEFKKLNPENKLDAVILANIGRFGTILNDFESSIRLGGYYLHWKKHSSALRWFLVSYATSSYEEQPAEILRTTDAVQLLTVHQAKGLEWPVVFIPCLVTKRFPSSRANEEFSCMVPDELYNKTRYTGGDEQERRAFYVAITRPKDLLCMSRFTKETSGRNRSQSKYLNDISIHLTVKTKEHALEIDVVKENESEDVLSFSPAQIIEYNKCPYYYRLRENWGYHAPLDSPMGYGKSLHNCLHELSELLKRGKKIDDAVKTVISTTFHLPYADASLQKKLSKSAAKVLTQFATKHKADLLNIQETEARLEFPLQNANISGRVDVILSGNSPGELEVRDYKSSEEITTPGESALQVRLYTIGLRKVGRNATAASIAYLDNAKIEPNSDKDRRAFVSPSNLGAAEKEASQTIEKIVACKFKAKKSCFCKECYYRTICREVK